jgi:hypothetical protein
LSYPGGRAGKTLNCCALFLASPRRRRRFVAITSVVDALAIFAYLFHGLVDFAVLLIDLGVTIMLISGRRPTDAATGGPLGISGRRSR